VISLGVFVFSTPVCWSSSPRPPFLFPLRVTSQFLETAASRSARLLPVIFPCDVLISPSGHLAIFRWVNLFLVFLPACPSVHVKPGLRSSELTHTHDSTLHSHTIGFPKSTRAPLPLFLSPHFADMYLPDVVAWRESSPGTYLVWAFASPGCFTSPHVDLGSGSVFPETPLWSRVSPRKAVLPVVERLGALSFFLPCKAMSPRRPVLFFCYLPDPVYPPDPPVEHPPCPSSSSTNNLNRYFC